MRRTTTAPGLILLTLALTLGSALPVIAQELPGFEDLSRRGPDRMARRSPAALLSPAETMGRAAVTWARSTAPTAVNRYTGVQGEWRGWALMFVSQAWGDGTGYTVPQLSGTCARAAMENFRSADKLVPVTGTIPAGAPIFWDTGDLGRVALSTGETAPDGSPLVISTWVDGGPDADIFERPLSFFTTLSGTPAGYGLIDPFVPAIPALTDSSVTLLTEATTTAGAPGAEAAIRWALEESPTGYNFNNQTYGDWTGWCLAFVSQAWWVGAGRAVNELTGVSARDSMNKFAAAGRLHPVGATIPAGAPVFWDYGDDGHIAIATGRVDANGEPLIASTWVGGSLEGVFVRPLSFFTAWVGTPAGYGSVE